MKRQDHRKRLSLRTEILKLLSMRELSAAAGAAIALDRPSQPAPACLDTAAC